MRRYLAFFTVLVVLAHGSAAVSFSPGDIEWAAASEGTLYKGSTLTNGEYTVKAVQFPSPVPGLKDIDGNIVPETEVDPMVFLEIYKNDVLMKELIMNLQSEPYIDPDYEVKVSATGFIARDAREWVFEYYNPWATVSVQLRAKPAIDVTVTTDKTTYISKSDQIIIPTVTVTNNGDTVLKNVDLYLHLGELKLRGGDASQLHKYYYRIEKGASQTFEVILVVPDLMDEKTYTLSADGKGYDIKELEFSASGSASLTVSPKQDYFTISKAVSKDRMYLQETILSRITIANSGAVDMYNINITDTMSEQFELRSNTTLYWMVPVLKSGQEWGTTYSIKPLEANIDGFTIPAAAAQFTVNNKNYSVLSQTPRVIVNGPKIVLNKTVDKPVVNISEDVTVTVSINNAGNIATKVEVKDSLPKSASLVSGSTALDSTFVELNVVQGFSYIIRMNKEGEFVLPAAVANYTGIEYRGAIRSVVSSERPVVTVVDPSKIVPTPVETADPQAADQNDPATSPTEVEPNPTLIAPGFEIVLAGIMLLFAARRR